MLSPTFRKEKELWRAGYRLIEGLDEVGRGAWAGPLVVGAVIFTPGTRIVGIRDSKLLTPVAREKLFPIIAMRAHTWAVGVVSAATVDCIGITASVRRAMTRALAHLSFLKKNLGGLEQLSCTPDHVLTDNVPFTWRVSCSAIVDGDTRVTSIAAASIIAKVWRDRAMVRMHRRFPHYGFDRHKGYGTAAHAAAIRWHGMSAIHRCSFVPKRCIL